MGLVFLYTQKQNKAQKKKEKQNKPQNNNKTQNKIVNACLASLFIQVTLFRTRCT